jgi:hypothetical protein
MISRMLVLGALLSCVVACSGGISGVGSGGDGGGGKDGGIDPFTDGGSPPGCTTFPTPLTRACVPGTAKANAAITIEVDGEGCTGCGSSLLPCKVDVTGTTIAITLEVRTCPLPENQACPAVCGVPSATCTIPPLAAGDYTIQLAGGGARTSEDPVRRLVVTANATATSCDIPDDRKTPTISAAEYPQACTGDQDCVLVTQGDVCQPCACPSGAISKTSIETYESDLRARQSLCSSRGGAVDCAPCQTVKAHCGSTGKCEALQ